VSWKPNDLRPRIISIPAQLSGIDIAVQQNILWPCHAFSVSIPQKKKRGLNIFEEVVLRMAECNLNDKRNIAEVLCLDVDLISFIQNRLRHLQLVDDRYALTKHGLEILEVWRGDTRDVLDYVVGTVFVDLHVGKLLPYVHLGQLKFQGVRTIEGNGRVCFNVGTTGRERNVNAKILSPSSESSFSIVPESGDVVKVIREFKKRSRQQAFLGQGESVTLPYVPMAEAISIHETPQLVYMHCNVIVQKGNTEILVTDGCGFGFSEIFASYLNHKADEPSWEWFRGIKSKGIVEEIESSDQTHARQRNIGWKYPEVTKRIKESQETLRELSTLPKTDSEERSYMMKRQRVLVAFYEALEWGLRYVVKYHPVYEWEQIFSSQNYKYNEKILGKFAEKIGLSLSKSNSAILQIKAGAIRQVEHGCVELQPLLALAIAGAATKYRQHPFHKLASNYPGFLSFVLQLKRLRDPVEHGCIKDFKVESDFLSKTDEVLTDVMIILLSGIESEIQIDRLSSAAYENEANQAHLKAEVALEKIFGYVCFRGLPHEIKELLTRLEIMMSRYSEDQSMEVIKTLASSIQLALFEGIVARLIFCAREGAVDSIKDVAINRTVEFGFCSSRNDVPEELRTVRNERVQRAAQGHSTTLGASLLALIFLCSNAELCSLKEADPNIVLFIAHLIKLRGHGNQELTFFSKDELETLKRESMKKIKTILEMATWHGLEKAMKS